MTSTRTVLCWCQAVFLLLLIVQCHSLPTRSDSSGESMLEKLQQAHSILGDLIDQIQSDKTNTKKEEPAEISEDVWDSRRADLEGLEEELERRNDGPEPREEDVDLRMQDPQPDPIESNIKADGPDVEEELEEEVLRRLSQLLESRRRALGARRTQQILSHAAHKRDHDIPFPFFGDY